MKPLLILLTLLAAPPFAAGQTPGPGCRDLKAWEFIQRNYPTAEEPDPDAFLRLDAVTRERLCAAAVASSTDLGAAGGPPEGKEVESKLSDTGRKVDALGKNKNPFGAAPGTESLERGLSDVPPAQGAGVPGKDAAKAAAAGARASKFKPQPNLKPSAPPPKPASAQPEAEVLSIQDGSRELIDKYGDPREALWKVITARGGDDGEFVSPADRRKAWAELNAVVGGLKDPDTLAKGESDERLRDFDHFLNAFGGVHGDGILRPDDGDGFIKGRSKILGRTAIGVGATVVTTGYTAVKWVDQTLGTPIGKWVGGYDFNSEKTSKASWNELWQGLKGAWYGVYTTDYGARKKR
ncbi:MAG: hypothetical protein HY924_14930 [Elusimicrobia bacterium]|nr:hypothetical protein [Elusimicrobiota bacterium]